MQNLDAAKRQIIDLEFKTQDIKEHTEFLLEKQGLIARLNWCLFVLHATKGKNVYKLT